MSRAHNVIFVISSSLKENYRLNLLKHLFESQSILVELQPVSATCAYQIIEDTPPSLTHVLSRDVQPSPTIVFESLILARHFAPLLANRFPHVTFAIMCDSSYGLPVELQPVLQDEITCQQLNRSNCIFLCATKQEVKTIKHLYPEASQIAFRTIDYLTPALAPSINLETQLNILVDLDLQQEENELAIVLDLLVPTILARLPQSRFILDFCKLSEEKINAIAEANTSLPIEISKNLEEAAFNVCLAPSLAPPGECLHIQRAILKGTPAIASYPVACRISEELLPYIIVATHPTNIVAALTRLKLSKTVSTSQVAPPELSPLELVYTLLDNKALEIRVNS